MCNLLYWGWESSTLKGTVNTTNTGSVVNPGQELPWVHIYKPHLRALSLRPFGSAVNSSANWQNHSHSSSFYSVTLLKSSFGNYSLCHCKPFKHCFGTCKISWWLSSKGTKTKTNQSCNSGKRAITIWKPFENLKLKLKWDECRFCCSAKHKLHISLFMDLKLKVPDLLIASWQQMFMCLLKVRCYIQNKNSQI